MTLSNGDVLATAESWLQSGEPVALATVVNTWGSAPRRAGSQMAIRADGLFAGSVSGGCVEGVVIEAAREATRDGKTRRMEFGVQDSEAWSVGLACGGRIEIFVEPVSTVSALRTVSAVNSARQERRAIIRAIALDTGEDRLIDPDHDVGPAAAAAASAARHDRSEMAEFDGREWFLCVYNPPLDLVIVGAVHIAQALAQMAAITGWNVRIVDPRAAFAAPDRFPDIALSTVFPDEALAETPLDRRSALVVLSHDPKIDDPALAIALASPAFYIGALGSRRTHAARLERLKARGFSPEQLARIHGPVGLAIAAATPEEIAISIVAQITETLRSAG